MALFLTEADVQELLPMERALECVEASFRAQAGGRAMNRARERILLPRCSLHYMAAALPQEKWLGMKIYTVTRADFRFFVLLFDAETGKLLALMQADHLGRLRTGAASGIATKYLARRAASRVGLIGTGRQARTQLEAVAQVRKLTAVKVFGRDEQRRLDFCREMSAHAALAGVAVEPAGSAEEAARFGEIVITATNSREPVVLGAWLEPGTHINAIGANMADHRELDQAAISRAAIIAVDSLEQSRKEAGDLIQALSRSQQGPSWGDVVELHSILAGAVLGRRSEEEITLFKSVGIALWDVAVAGYLYCQALEKGKGRQLDLG
jgi:ornithine cyclodeaminase/alanine dehydrogenase-like protein (mu-crystallin family)